MKSLYLLFLAVCPAMVAQAVTVEGFAFKAKDASEDKINESEDLRMVFTRTRTVGLFHSIQVNNNSRLSQKVSEVLKIYDDDIRNCYSSEIDGQVEVLDEQVNFSFEFNNRDGYLKELVHIGKIPQKARLYGCLVRTLKEINFYTDGEFEGVMKLSFNLTVD